MPTIKFSILILFILFCNGCWDRKELKTQAIVAGVGVDRLATADKNFRYTFQVIKPSEVKSSKSSSGGGEGEAATKPFWMAQSEGRTPYDAGRNFALFSSRGLFLPHNEVLVIGRDTAKQGVLPIIDLDLRYPQIRYTELVVIAKGEAHDVLDARIDLEKISAYGIADLINESKYSSKAIPVNLLDFFATLISKTQAPVAPEIEVFDDGKEKSLRLSGTAVFKRDRWVGELNGTETRGLLWVLGQVKHGNIDIATKPHEEQAAIEITGASSKISPKIHNGKVAIQVQIDVQGNLGNILVAEDLTAPDQMHKLEKLANNRIRQEIIRAWEKTRLLNTDVFGFGETVHRKYPRQWKAMEPTWDQIFPAITLEIKVNTVLKRVGEIVQPAIPQ